MEVIEELDQENNTEAALRKGKILTQAVLNAAKYLGLNDRQLSSALEISTDELCDFRLGSNQLVENTKSFIRAVYLIRVYRSIFAIMGGDELVMHQWMKSPDTALDAIPIEIISTWEGLESVINYLDARRTPI